MLKHVAYALVALCVVGPAAIAAQTPAGKWKMTIAFSQGDTDADLAIRISGRSVTGTFESSFSGGAVPIEGEIDGDKLTFSAATTGGPHPGQQLDFSATLSGNRMTGKVEAFFGAVDFTAERQP